MTTLVCFALKEEAGAFRRATAGRADVSILITGVGRKNAARSVQESLGRIKPATVFTCGFAGGLDPALVAGSVVFATDDLALKGKLTAAGATSARILCAANIAITVAEKAELKRTSVADAVEMESEAIQTICRERGIPCATVRVISDTASEDLPLDFNALSKPDLSIDFGKLAMAIARQPSKIPALMRLQKNCAFAADQLAKVLSRVV
jgi:adenosylhomocysteine nucleosidase